MKKWFFILFIFTALLVKAQPGKEASHWYFGNKCHIDFSSGSPVTTVATGNLISAVESSSSISDQSGQHLFTIIGGLAINKNLTAMSNGYGLKSDIYADQGSVVIPKPGSSSLYYVITNEPMASQNWGIRYSIVDMSLQGSLGAVTTKNVALMAPPNTDKLIAARHCNGEDYWILTHPFLSNAIHAYLVTANGISLTPVVSNVGTLENNYSGVYDETGGYLKVSPNGKKVALGIWSTNIPILELFDFDNSTGVVTNPITINYAGQRGPYGVTFSPDNSKLYSAPATFNGDTSFIYQYDLSSGVASTIIASQTLIAKSTTYFGAMQIGPDAKIYVARFSANALPVINNPNIAGSGCNYQVAGLALAAGTTCNYGLPNFIDANYAGIQLNIPDLKLCNSVIADTLDAGPGYSNYYWSTGASSQSIVINDTGKYWVTVTNKQGCTRTDTVRAYMIKTQKQNVTACVSYTTNVTQASVLTYNWSNGSNSSQNIFNTSGTYWVDIAYIGGCAVRDSFVVTINPDPVVDLGSDSIFCNGNLPLNAFNPNATYQWSTGETTSFIIAKEAGTYWVKVDMNNCFAYDTVEVIPDPHIFNFAMPNIVTPNDDQINDEIHFSKYQFSSLQITIYNRWGQKVFTSSDAKAIWKPTGDEGTYFYSGQYKIDCGVDSQAKTLKGFITVVR